MASIRAAYGSLAQNFTAKNPTSKSLHDRATASLPGGNTRSVLFYSPFPLSITKASGSKLYDADGHIYTDLLGEYTAGLYGHSDPTILSAIQDALSRGLSFGSHHADETKLAEQIKARFEAIDLLRFTNSGTEATLMALALAKVYTSKKKILVFANAYHGGAFSFKGMGSSPVNAPHEYLIAEYNNLSPVHALIRDPANAKDIAAIIVEPMTGSGGAIPADRSFLEGLRVVANEVGAVLIFDEVMTSRMHAGGGIQSQLPRGMRPDLTTLGKYIGGGMSFGAFGGKHEIMSLFDLRNPNALAHAGTFNNNVLTMAAGRAGLEKVFTPEMALQLHETGDRLRKRLQDISRGTMMKVTGYGSIMCFHFVETPVEQIKSHKGLTRADTRLNDLLHLFLLEHGYYIARRSFIALSLVLTDAELDRFVRAVEQFVAEYRPLLVRDSAPKL